MSPGGHETAAHGYRWVYQYRMAEAEEREFIRRARDSIAASVGIAPSGWLSRLLHTDDTRRLLAEEGFDYHMDDYSGDMPFREYVQCADGTHRPILVMPYALDSNDMKMWTAPSLTPADWARYAIDTFDWLLEESASEGARMMSLGLHLRIIGRPARAGALRRVLDHVSGRDDVWIATRRDIAAAWAEAVPTGGADRRLASVTPWETTAMTQNFRQVGPQRYRESFGRYYDDFEVGDIYEHRPGKTVTEYDNHMFTLLTLNTHPLHFDREYGKATEFGRNLVVSPYTLALLMGMSVTDVSAKAIANLGMEEVRFSAPVFAGDTLYAHSEVVGKRESRSPARSGDRHGTYGGHEPGQRRGGELPAQRAHPGAGACGRRPYRALLRQARLLET